MFQISFLFQSKADKLHLIEKIENHFNNLKKTKLVGEINFDFVPQGIIACDGVIQKDNVDAFNLMATSGYKMQRLIEGQETIGNQETGEFLHFSLKEKNLEGYSDPSGSHPLYFGSSKTVAGISNDPIALAYCLGFEELDLDVVFEMMRYGHAIGRSSSIKGIKRVFAGEQISLNIIDNRLKVSISRRDSPARSEEQKKIDPINVFNALCDKIKQLPVELENSYAQISGGLDSRLTLGALKRSGRLPKTAITVNLSNGDEILIANQVAQKLQIVHSVLELDQYAISTAKRGWFLTGGQASVHGAAGNILLYDLLLEKNESVVVVGGWPGDCLIGSYVPKYRIFLSRNLAYFALRYWTASRGLPKKELLEVLRKFTECPKKINSSEKRLLRSLGSFKGKTAANTVSLWAMYRRQPAFSYVSPARLSSKVLEVTPLLDEDYLDSLKDLSAIDLIDKNFYQNLIYLNLEELNTINYFLTSQPPKKEYLVNIPRLPFKYIINSLMPISMSAMIQRILLFFGFDLTHRSKRDKSNEEIAWRAVFESYVNSPLRINEIEINLNSKSSNYVHFMGVALALSWTEEYLKTGRYEIQ